VLHKAKQPQGDKSGCVFISVFLGLLNLVEYSGSSLCVCLALSSTLVHSGFLGLLNLVEHPGSSPVLWDYLTLSSTLAHLRFSGTTEPCRAPWFISGFLGLLNLVVLPGSSPVLRSPRKPEMNQGAPQG
jgi:hypothetical protein